MARGLDRDAGAAQPVTDRRFWIWLGGIALAGLTASLVYGLAVAPTLPARGDTLLYHYLANGIADGSGYIRPFSQLQYGEALPTAAYPPLFPLYLSFWSLLGLDSLEAHRAVSCLLAPVAVVLIGLLGRRVGGARVGLIAAGLAAIYPQLVMVDGTVITEALYAPLIAGVLLLTYRLLDHPGPWSAAFLGLAIGAATMTRSEAIFLVVLLALPAAVIAGRRIGRAPLLCVIAVACTAIVLVPWVVRNEVTLGHPILFTSNSGHTAAATVCDATFDAGSPYLGFARHECALQGPCVNIRDELKQASCQRDEARRYMEDHLGRVPVVVAVRILRVWELYGYKDDLGYGELWSRSVPVAKAGLVMYALLVLLGIGGLVALRRARTPLWPLLVPFLLVTISAALTFGFSRYRLAAEIPLVVLGATGLDWTLRALGARRRDQALAAPGGVGGEPGPGRPGGGSRTIAPLSIRSRISLR
jgi:4-amino-4-deoxy-L-arabinose transferase-like glycosyltransferase